MQNKKRKYNKRRALICKLDRASRQNKGYFKCNVTIGERNGKITRTPAYGKDMQDALQRLLWKERTERLEKKFGFGWVFFAWIATMGWPALIIEEHTPMFLVFSMGSVILLFSTLVWWWTYINKK